MTRNGEYLDGKTGELVVDFPVRFLDIGRLAKGGQVPKNVAERAARFMAERRKRSQEHKPRVYHSWEQ